MTNKSTVFFKSGVNKTKIVAIVGPTASGKSELAVKLAQKFSGEIVSADSRQVYRGLDIGSGKVKGKWTKNVFIYKNIPHYCLDFVPPRKIFTAAEYKKSAAEAISKIAERGKTPILVGGTGFWLNTVIYGLSLPEVPPNFKLRRKLEKKSPAELYKTLKKLDAGRAKTIERKNPRRLIRAIEIALALGKVPKLEKSSPYQTLWIGLKLPNNILERKIKERVKKMIRAGLLTETKKLLKNGVGQKRIREFGFEYQAGLDVGEKKLSQKELAARLSRGTTEYVRRQLVWFKRNPEIHWISTQSKAENLVRKFLA